jgi:hypothetical protein
MDEEDGNGGATGGIGWIDLPEVEPVPEAGPGYAGVEGGKHQKVSGALRESGGAGEPLYADCRKAGVGALGDDCLEGGPDADCLEEDGGSQRLTEADDLATALSAQPIGPKQRVARLEDAIGDHFAAARGVSPAIGGKDGVSMP